MTKQNLIVWVWVLVGTACVAAIIVVGSALLEKHDPNSEENVDKRTKDLCQILDAEFYEGPAGPVCIQNGKVVYPR